MATTPTISPAVVRAAASAPPLSVSITDPVSGDIQAICAAIGKICDVLVSPEGQAALATIRQNNDTFTANLAKVGAWFQGLFK